MSAATEPGTGAFSTEVPALLKAHFEQLHTGSGISVEVIRDRGYYSALGAHALAEVGFSKAQQRPAGLLLPVHGPDGTVTLHTYRPDAPRVGVGGKTLKYEMPRGGGARLDVPPRCLQHMADPSVPIWITEGQKKVDAMASHGVVAIALLGVWQFIGKNDFGGVTLLADFDLIAWNGRQVHIAFDSDVMQKHGVRAALERLTEHLQRKGAIVSAVYLPSVPGGSKTGVDDYLLTHSVDELRQLLDEPPVKPSAQAPGVELLDVSPPTLTRPLALVDGRAYAASWLWVKTTVTETLAKDGTIVHHEPPIVTKTRQLVIIRDDGRVFGAGCDAPLEELSLDVQLGQPPRDAKLWSAPGVKAYRAGVRPDPRDVLRRLVEVVDAFMSFDRSLAPQRTMCEFVACYAMCTWFLDGFDSVGFLWPNGPYGSGKTKLGLLVVEIAYLGEALLSGSSYSTLRDLADMGATLLFDDAEALADPRKTDPDKRNLLLAGNRRGSYVTVKEPGPDRTWTTRYVNAFCARMFTATRLPDPILASRSIVVPLVRTGDRAKANSEVLDHATWPHDQRALLDDLWAVGLAHLGDIARHVVAVNADSPLLGRNLEPWRPVLAVAHWLDELGEAGLYRRLVEMSKAYQAERVTLEFADATRVVIRALVDIATPLTPSAPFAPFVLEVGAITGRANQIARDEDLASDDQDFTTQRKVGRILTTLRLRQAPKASGQARQRLVTRAELEGIAAAYGFSFLTTETPEPPKQTGQTGQTGLTGRFCELCDGPLTAADISMCRDCRDDIFQEAAITKEEVRV